MPIRKFESENTNNIANKYFVGFHFHTKTYLLSRYDNTAFLLLFVNIFIN